MSRVSSFWLSLFLVSSLFTTLGQPAFNLPKGLQPSINNPRQPRDTDRIDPMGLYIDPTEEFKVSGYYEREYVRDFTLYTPDGTVVNLGDQLKLGKPVVLVDGSFSCHAFRYRVPEINAFYDRYKDSMQMFVILTYEAHPAFEASIYYGYINNSVQNQRDNIYIHQPQTYLQRRWLADSVRARTGLKPTILLDDRNNSFLRYFGPAPNSAYIISPNGRVVEKEGWFNRAPDNMPMAMDSILGHAHQRVHINGKCIIETGFETVFKGISGMTQQTNIRVDNFSPDAVELGIRRQSQQMPEGWASSFCTNICYDTGSSYVRFFLNPMESGFISVDVRTAAGREDSGKLKLNIVNLHDSTNQLQTELRFYSYKDANEIIAHAGPELHMYPSSTRAMVFLECSELDKYSLTIYNRLGKANFTFATGRIPSILNLQFLEPGIYSFVFMRDGQKITRKYIRP